MKAFLAVVSTVAVVLASQVSVADSGNPIFRTDRLSIIKPSSEENVTNDRTRVKRSDRIVFDQVDTGKEVGTGEVVRRSDRIVFTKSTS